MVSGKSEKAFRELRKMSLPSDVAKRIIEGHEVADVTLPPEIMKTATVKARENLEKIQKEGKEKRRVRNVIEDEDFNTLKDQEVGVQGQLAFAEYAFGDWKRALNYMVDVFGVDNTYRGRTIEVKTRRGFCAINSYLMVSINQWNWKKYDFYVGCSKQEVNVVRIWGFATKEEMGKAEQQDFGHCMDLVIPYKDLHPIKEMLDLSPA